MTNERIETMKRTILAMEQNIIEGVELTVPTLSMLCNYMVEILDELKEKNNEG